MLKEPSVALISLVILLLFVLSIPLFLSLQLATSFTVLSVLNKSFYIKIKQDRPVHVTVHLCGES
jgi:hypothetical protein